MGISDKEYLNNLNDLRYNFEHYLLPGWFYVDGKKFTDALVNKETFIDLIFFNLCKDADLFDIWIKGYDQIHSQDDDLNAIIITCPNCILTPQCNKIFMVWDDTKRFYFTLEFDEIMSKLSGIEPYFILCGWDKERKHVNFGPFNESNDKLIAKIKELFVNV